MTYIHIYTHMYKKQSVYIVFNSVFRHGASNCSVNQSDLRIIKVYIQAYPHGIIQT